MSANDLILSLLLEKQAEIVHLRGQLADAHARVAELESEKAAESGDAPPEA